MVVFPKLLSSLAGWASCQSCPVDLEVTFVKVLGGVPEMEQGRASLQKRIRVDSPVPACH